MRESLRTFIFREAGNSGEDRLSLLRDVAPHIYIERGYDVDELRELHSNDGGSEYVSASWPEVPVLAPLHCIAIRPYSQIGHQGSPYELVARVAGHLRDVLADAVLEPDYDDLIRHVYVQREHLEDWAKAAARWRQSHAGPTFTAALEAPAASPAPTAGAPQVLPKWTLREPTRYQGYARPLYLVLKAAHGAGKGCPKPRDVLDAFSEKMPPEVIGVQHDGLAYYDARGNSKVVGLEAIAEAIRRMTS